MKDKDRNDLYIIGDTKLLEFTSLLQNKSNNVISASTITLNNCILSPERPETSPLPDTVSLLKQISEANMPEVRGNLKKVNVFQIFKFIFPLFTFITYTLLLFS